MARVEPRIRPVTRERSESSLADEHEGSAPRVVQRVKRRLLELARPSLPPVAFPLLELVDRYLEGEPLEGELAEGRADVWAQVGTLACYCSVDDSAALRSVLAVLETDEGAHAPSSLERFAEDVAILGVAPAAIERELSALGGGGPR